MSELLKGPIYITDWEGNPWHEHNVHIHCSYSRRLRETTLTLFTKDHQKVVKLTDKEYTELATNYLQNNWCLEQKREWQRELRTMYQNMGD